MRLDLQEPHLVVVTLSRRNLLALLAKLDGHPPDSACTISFRDRSTTLYVRAEPDSIHYGQRDTPPGPMDPETEAWIRTPSL